MSRSLILDPRSERAANAPLEVYAEHARGPGVYVTSHKYPDPEQEILSAGGREGKRRSGPPMLGNRQIPLELFVMGRRDDFAAAPVNLSTNPKGELAAKYAGVGADFAITRERETGAVPSYMGEYRDKHAYDGAGVDSNAGLLNVTFPVAGTYTVSIWLWIPSTWDGAAPKLALETWFGGVVESTGEADLAVSEYRTAEGRKLTASLFFPDLSLNWVMRFIQPSRATQFRSQPSSACAGTWL